MVNTAEYRTSQFFTKAQLYSVIEKIRKTFHLRLEDYPIDIYSLLDEISEYIDYQETDFEAEGFCGLLFRNRKKSHIVINKYLPDLEKTFATTHETVHFFCHDRETKFMCKPFEKRVNDAFEWQANEGAAELLLPYKVFIHDFVQTLGHYEGDNVKTITAMSKTYGLSETVIDYRLNNLRYEFEQYLKGIPIDNIQILSRKKYLQFKAEGSL